MTAMPITFRQVKSGDDLSVAYNPASPGEARIVQSPLAAGMSWVLGVTGLLLLVSAVAAYQLAKDDKSSAEDERRNDQTSTESSEENTDTSSHSSHQV